MSTQSRNQFLAYLLLALLMLGAMRVFENQRHPSLKWLVPFVSGAANYEFGMGWRFNEHDVELYKEIPTWDERTAHRTEASNVDQLIPWQGTSRGYLFVILLARTLLPWMGDLDAVMALQQIMHILVTIAVSLAFRSRVRRIAFCVLYGLNPLVLHIVTYPMYYYWQTIPAAFAVAYLVNGELKFGRLAFLIVPVLAAIYVVRPTSLFISIFLIAMIGLRESRAVASAALVLFLVLAMIVFEGNKHETNPWHTAYTAVGAYPNPYGIEFKDWEGDALYERKTGRTIKWGPGGDFYNRPDIVEEYGRYEQEAFLEIAKEHPAMLLRNAILNYFQTFSVGYVNASILVSYVSSLSGFIFLGLLLWKRKWPYAIAISSPLFPFIVFAPPVHIYMFACYILIVGAAVEMVVDEVEARRGISAPAAR